MTFPGPPDAVALATLLTVAVGAAGCGSRDLLEANDGLPGDSTILSRFAPEASCPAGSIIDPAVLVCDTFDEASAVGDRWNEYASASGAFVPVAGIGINGSTGMRVRFQPGQVNAGRFSIAMGDVPDEYASWRTVGSGNVREIYWREYIRFAPGWTGITFKQSRLRVLADPDPSDPGPLRSAFQAHFWPDTRTDNAFTDGVLFFNNTRGVDSSGNVIDRGNNTNTSIWLPRTAGATAIYGNRPDGSDWICIEAHVRLNDPGQSNGIEEFWVDGQLEASRSDQDHVGVYDTYGINQVVFDNYWNGGSPDSNVLYRDNIVISTEPIGCLESLPD